MKALVLGSSGFLGSHLGFSLPREGWEVSGVARHEVPYFPRSTTVSSAEDIAAYLENAGVEVVINAIAMASHEVCDADPSGASRINAELPGVWAKVCQAVGVRFVHISTDAVFDGKSAGLYSEDDGTQPQSVYGATKLAGEESVRLANPESLILRTNFFTWSRSGDVGILDFFYGALSKGAAITGFTDYRVSSLYAGHVSEAMVGLVELGASGLFHCVAKEPMSKYDFGLAVAKEFGLNSASLAKGSLAEATHLVSRGRNLGLSTAKMESVLGRAMQESVDGLALAHRERDALMEYFGHHNREGTT